jgi:hypothetical protein
MEKYHQAMPDSRVFKKSVVSISPVMIGSKGLLRLSNEPTCRQARDFFGTKPFASHIKQG